jgi:hypothetical protein
MAIKMAKLQPLNLLTIREQIPNRMGEKRLTTK